MMINVLLTSLFQAREKRPGSICSFIAVVYQVACMLKDGQEVFVDRSMHEILPWCMAQHFSVRLYAQVTIFLQCIEIFSMS
jgi:hypothetical protein